MYRNELRNRDAVDFTRSWEFVTIPGRFRPARHKFNFETGIYSIALVAFNVVPVGKEAPGGTGKPDVLHFRSTSVSGLREVIEKAYPDAVFSQANPEQDIKAVHAAEVKAQKAQEKAAQDEVKKAEELIAAHRQMAYSMTETQIFEATKNNIINFMKIEPWKAWFAAPENYGFMTFPNSSNQNRKTLVAICDSKGYIIPINGELDECLRYGLSNGHFYRKNKYKRSETDEYNAVKPFTGIVANARTAEFSDGYVHAARQQLRKALPVGQVPSEERIQATAKELGFSNALLNAILGRSGSWKEQTGLASRQPAAAASIAKSDFAGKSAAELKKDLARMRPMVDPARRRQGY